MRNLWIRPGGVDVHKTYPTLFLSVGAMKAGTTWLYAVLKRHPALHFAMEKEIHFFYHQYIDNTFLSEERRLREARNRYVTRFQPKNANIDVVRQNLFWVAAYLDRPVSDLWYRNLFQLRRGQVYACDFSNLNALLPAEAWSDISSKCEDLRVLYTMRDPIKRLWSHTKFQLQLIDQVENLATWGPEDFHKFVKQDHIWKNAEYGQALRTFKAGLAPELLQVMFYEDIHADQRGSLRQIEDFLGLEHCHYPQPLLEKRFTESVKHKMPDFFPELFADDMARIRSEIEDEGYTLPESWG